jgi:transcriptional regulator with XRE-family HTH domain
VARERQARDEHELWGRVCRELRTSREDAGLSQADLAELIGKHQTFVSKLEAGERRPGLLEVWQICRLLGLPLEDFARRLNRTGR